MQLQLARGVFFSITGNGFSIQAVMKRTLFWPGISACAVRNSLVNRESVASGRGTLFIQASMHEAGQELVSTLRPASTYQRVSQDGMAVTEATHPTRRVISGIRAKGTGLPACRRFQPFPSGATSVKGQAAFSSPFTTTPSRWSPGMCLRVVMSAMACFFRRV